MNVQQTITNLIHEFHSQNPKVARKQYPVGKAQIAKLTELGIIDLMPKGYGFSDAALVIEAFSTERMSRAYKTDVEIEQGL